DPAFTLPMPAPSADKNSLTASPGCALEAVAQSLLPKVASECRDTHFFQHRRRTPMLERIGSRNAKAAFQRILSMMFGRRARLARRRSSPISQLARLGS